MNKNKISLLLAIIISFSTQAERFNLEALDHIENTNEVENILFHLDNQPEGFYSVDIVINNQKSFTENIQFKRMKNRLSPTFTKKHLIRMGLTNHIINILFSINNDITSNNLETVIDGYSDYFDFNHLVLNINIPQMYLNLLPYGNEEQEHWDHGITSAFIEYDISGSHNTNNKLEKNNHINLSLQNGFNYIGWRLRNSFTYSQENKWQFYNTTLSYPLALLKSQLIIDEYYLASSFFMPFTFKGISLSNDELMYPDYDSYFSPILQGINYSPSQVTVTQNNIVIYNEHLPAGPFTLNRLKPLSHKGFFQMTITETNGKVRKYLYPYSSTPLMIKSGQFRYALNSGKTTEKQGTLTPYFIHGEIKYGINNHLTTYTGVILSSPFKSLTVGGSFTNYLGDFTLDWSHAYSHEERSNTYQIEYSRTFVSTGSDISFSTQWIDNPKIRQISDVIKRMPPYYPHYPQQTFKLHISQPISHYGNLSLSASQQKFANTDNYQWLYNIGYSGNIHEYHFSLNYQSNYSFIDKKSEHAISAALIIPISAWLPNTHFSYQTQLIQNSYHNHQATLTGTTEGDHFMAYTLQHNYRNPLCCSTSDPNSETRVYTQYQHHQFSLNAGYGYNQHHQISYGLHSAIVAHPYGVTFTPSRGDTAALIIVPETKNVHLDHHTNNITDSAGHTIVNYLQPYRRNSFAIDTQTLPLEAEIDDSNQSILPTKGALVAVHFPVKLGKRAFFTIQLTDGSLAPFGAIASLSTKDVIDTKTDINVGIISDMGQVYLSGLESSGTIKLKWGEQQSQQCEFEYQLLASHFDQGFYHLPAICQRKEAL
ncbi:Outer membrane usher protein YraJ [Providencia manganoxydans]|uniref:fimbria/pilus outer membrane usher protein n=1 Tax=Providencia manganoxydans TaxID=2923283 RepID=UPI003B9D9580